MVLENASQGKKPHERLRLRWEDRVKDYVKKVGPEMDWIELLIVREN